MLFFILKLGLARVAQMYASEPVLAEYHLATQSARFAAWPVRVRQRAAGGLAIRRRLDNLPHQTVPTALPQPIFQPDGSRPTSSHRAAPRLPSATFGSKRTS